MYSGFTQGTQKFFEIFAIDRPARAYLVSLAYSLFGTNAPLYSYSAYFLRVCSALGLLWIFQMIWPGKKKITFFMIALFAVYPGFLDQPNAIDYQSHLFSFALAILSIALTVKSVLSPRSVQKIVWMVSSMLLTLGYLFLMEYYIGLGSVSIFVDWVSCSSWAHFISRHKERIHPVYPCINGEWFFMLWRIFLFDNQRAATDIGSMFNNLASSPAMKLLWNVVYLIQDTFNVIFLAWAIPLYQIGFRMRLRDNADGFSDRRFGNIDGGDCVVFSVKTTVMTKLKMMWP